MARRLVAQRRPLLDTEPVLLVDDHGTERVELDPFLDEGVRADRDVDRAVGEPGQHVLALGAGDPVGEQLDTERPIAEQVARVGHLQIAEQLPDAGGVLLGQHLGRRHEGALVAALHRSEQRRHGDHGLAGADVALEQAVHRMG